MKTPFTIYSKSIFLILIITTVTIIHTLIVPYYTSASRKISGKLIGSVYKANPAVIRIMPLGDSITNGVDMNNTSPGYRKSLFLQLTGRGYNIDFVGSLSGEEPGDFDQDHEGHCGWMTRNDSDTSFSVLHHLTNFLIFNVPDIVLLHLGTNDISNENSNPYNIASGVINILDSINNFDPDIITLVAKIIDRKDNEAKHLKTTAFNQILEDRINSLPAVRRKNIVLVDMYRSLGDYFMNPGNLNFSDDIHPSSEGYVLMANTWFEILRNILSFSVTS